MALPIDTFDNRTGGNCFFKAIGHPAAQPGAKILLGALGRGGPVALYDPHGFVSAFAAIHPLAGVDLAGVFVQDVRRVGETVLGHAAQPVTDLPRAGARRILLIGFDAERSAAQIHHLVPPGSELLSLDAMRVPPERLTNPARYLDPLNFATNFAFFRDAEGLFTRLVTTNYWSGYGAKDVRLWLTLFDGDGRTIAEWHETLPDGMGSIVVDSREVRRRFGLPPFAGQLFLHAVGAAGHDVVKYALDTGGADSRALSCTHDANAWPADLYAGLPAPRPDERVVLWVQNSHPCAIPENGVGLNAMGSRDIRWLDRGIEPFASYPLDVSALLPDIRWPSQIEIRAGRYFVRPRYEVVRADGRRRIAHPNVERTDLKPDPEIAELGNLLGKGFILPAPILPLGRYATTVLPTPMSTAQRDLPIVLVAYDPSGREIGRRALGRLPRGHAVAVEADTVLATDARPPEAYGHLEICYDFAQGGEADGWLHALFRYEDRTSGHAAETSFGAHIFNTALTFRSEPQSYAGPPPGLSTRLFLRLGPRPLDTLCHLIYPASTPWHAHSETELVLVRSDGRDAARRSLAIPCGGSRLWLYSQMFDAAERDAAGDGAYIVVRDRTCRLFGYHGLIGADGAFSLDHMFGF